MSGFFAILVAVGCSSSPTDPVAATSETASVEITPDEVKTPSGLRARFTATVRNGQGQVLSDDVDWSTSDPTVAIVDSDGTVWSFKSGTTTATATFPGNSGSSSGNAYGRAKKDAKVQVVEDTPDRPGQVTDLAVTNTTSSVATLSFTEVDDGQGGAADYLVRFQVAPLSWGYANDVSAGSCAAPLQGSGKGSTVSCTVESLVAETAYQFQVVAIRRSDDVHGDLSNVASGTTLGSQPISTNASRLAKSSFPCLPDIGGASCVDAGDWSTYDPSGRLAGVNGVLRHTMPRGQRPGTGGATMDVWDNVGSPTLMKEMYVSHRVRLVSGDNDGLYEFYSGTNKLGFFGYQGNTPSDFFVRAQPSGAGSGTGELRSSAVLGIAQQNNVSRSAWSNTHIQVDTWHHWEFQFVLNNPANNYEVDGKTRGDGIFRWWQDGKLILELKDVAFATDTSHGFFGYRWNPTWGGGTGHDDKARTDYIEVDDLYIAGIPK
jgi:hypothetical protein